MVMYDNDHHAWAGCGAEVAWRWREVQFKFPPKCFGYSTKSYVGVDTLLKFSPSSPFSVVRIHEILLDNGNLRQVSLRYEVDNKPFDTSISLSLELNQNVETF